MEPVDRTRPEGASRCLHRSARPVVVGRTPGADIVIGAGYVSARHACFNPMGQNLFIEDLGSTNGTAVNGKLIAGP